MKTMTRIGSWRGGLGALGLTGLLLLSGCLDERIVWSPDGSHAAVVGKDGLYLCDADGHLSPLLLPQVSAAAWLGDSQRLVVARRREIKDWAGVAKLVGPERAAPVEVEAESVWRQFQGGGVWSELMSALKDDKDLMKICLRDRHAADLKAKLKSGEWDDLAAKAAMAHDLVIARLDGGNLVVGAGLYDGLGEIRCIRVSPNNPIVAFTVEMKLDKDGLQLLVAPMDGGAPVVVVARNVSAYPDWTPDGRSLAYFTSGEPGEDDIRLGVLARREVLDADGRIKVAEKPDFLAGALFNDLARVRCLRDGRILFNAMEISLPIAAEDYDDRREQLFALDPARQPTLVRLIARKHEEELPKQLGFFEVSPDERQVVFGSTKGEVCLLTLATGEVERIQAELKDSPQGAPVWRKTGELTYVKQAAAKEGATPARKAEVILRQGKQETVLSQSWPDDVLKGVTE